MSDVVTQFLSGMTTAATLFMVAAGLTLVFGAMRVINFAHGSYYMYGAFLAAAVIGHSGNRLWLALVVAPLAAAGLGLASELLVMRRIYRREHLTQLLATFALFLVFADLALRIWGGSFRNVPKPGALDGKVPVGGGAQFPVYNLFVMGVAAVVGVGLWLLLQRTRLGWRIRAAAEDTETLATTGTDVRLLFTVVFVLGAGLAGVAGAVVSPLVTVAPGIDVGILVEAFIVAVIGGLGSVTGAAVGAVLLGLTQAVGVLWVPTWSSAFIYLAMIVVLVVRPWGLLGAAER
jgi:branched-subunit amino acid ABC-type transport system permease component